MSKKAKKSMCHLVIVDASGSMTGKMSEVKEEIRDIIISNKKDKSLNTHTIICDFSGTGDFKVLVNEPNRKLLDETSCDKYSTRGYTALYDAVGKSFELVKGNYDGIIVSIITDGMENASREYKLDDIKSLIESKRKEGWLITFSGVDESSINSAVSMGISRGNTISYDNTSLGMKLSNKKRSRVKQMYATATLDSLDIDLNNVAQLVEEEV